MLLTDERKNFLGETYLLCAAIPNENDCRDLTIQDLAFMMRAAEGFYKQNTAVNAHFGERMQVFRRVLIEKLRGGDEMYVLVNSKTTFPQIGSDGAIWLFSSEALAKKAQEHYAKENLTLEIRRLAKGKGFWMQCQQWGMERMLLDMGAYAVPFARKEVLPEIDFSTVPESKRPVMNGGLVYAVLRHKQLLLLSDRESENGKKLERYFGDLMFKEMTKTRFLCPVKVENPGGEAPDENGKVKLNQGAKIQYALARDKEGNLWQPVFTDWNAFTKLYSKEEWQGQLLSIDDLLTISKDNGIVVDPALLELRLQAPQKALVKAYSARRQKMEQELAAGGFRQITEKIQLKTVQEVPEEFRTALHDALRAQKEVRRAWLNLKIEGDDICYFLLIDGKFTDKKAVVKAVGDTVRPQLKLLFMDLRIADEKSLAWVEGEKPFYEKKRFGLF